MPCNSPGAVARLAEEAQCRGENPGSYAIQLGLGWIHEDGLVGQQVGGNQILGDERKARFPVASANGGDALAPTIQCGVRERLDLCPRLFPEPVYALGLLPPRPCVGIVNEAELLFPENSGKGAAEENAHPVDGVQILLSVTEGDWQRLGIGFDQRLRTCVRDRLPRKRCGSRLDPSAPDVAG